MNCAGMLYLPSEPITSYAGLLTPTRKHHPLPNNLITLWRRWTYRRLINRITSPLWLITTLRLLQLNAILLATISVSTPVVSVVPIITIKSVPRRLIPNKWRIWRSRTTIIGLIGIIVVRVTIVLALRRLAGKPACSVHRSHSMTSSAAVVKASRDRC